MKRAVLFPVMMMSLVLSGCMHCQSKEDKTMRPLASALTKLSSETEAVVRYGTPPAKATDEDLLKLATRNDPGFLDTFRGYRLRVRSEDRHATVLLCSQDGKRGLLEDLGCTAALDRNLWRELAAMPCEFTLSVAFGCRLKQ